MIKLLISIACIVSGMGQLFVEELHSFPVSINDTRVDSVLVLDVNQDMFADTLYFNRQRNGVLLDKIVWGKNSSNSGQTVASTSFVYPEWSTISIFTNLLRLNSEDDIKDLMLTITGTVSVAEEQVEDTTLRIGLFSEYGYDAMDTIDIRSISVAQTFPYAACHITLGLRLVQAQTRDNSLRQSFMLRRLPINVSSRSAISAPSSLKGKYKVFPNPASQILSLQCIECASSHETQIGVLFSANGQQVMTIEDIPTKNETKTINISSLSSGIYFLVLRGGKGEEVIPISIYR